MEKLQFITGLHMLKNMTQIYTYVVFDVCILSIATKA